MVSCSSACFDCLHLLEVRHNLQADTCMSSKRLLQFSPRTPSWYCGDVEALPCQTIAHCTPAGCRLEPSLRSCFLIRTYMIATPPHLLCVCCALCQPPARSQAAEPRQYVVRFETAVCRFEHLPKRRPKRVVWVRVRPAGAASGIMTFLLDNSDVRRHIAKCSFATLRSDDRVPQSRSRRAVCCAHGYQVQIAHQYPYSI